MGDVCYKLVILGASTVGKSSLVAHYTRGKDLSYKEITFVATYNRIYLDNSHMFDTWEVAGERRWHELAHLYYKDAQAALVVYDVQNPESLVTAKDWIEELQRKVPQKLVIALAGNKTDLWDDCCIDSEEVKTYAQQHGYIFMETSVKTGLNITELFSTIARELQTQQSRKSTLIAKSNDSCTIQ